MRSTGRFPASIPTRGDWSSARRHPVLAGSMLWKADRVHVAGLEVSVAATVGSTRSARRTHWSPPVAKAPPAGLIGPAPGDYNGRHD